MPSPGSYSHVVATYDGTTMSLYLNGIHNSDKQDTDPRITSTAMGIGENFVGSIDEVAIYDHALDAGRVSAHFHASGR
jgi:hypothetical protein